MLVKIMTEHVISQTQNDNQRKGSEKHTSLRLALVREPLIPVIFIITQPKSQERISFSFHVLPLTDDVLF